MAADVTMLAARLGVMSPTMYAWVDSLVLARDEGGVWMAPANGQTAQSG